MNVHTRRPALLTSVALGALTLAASAGAQVTDIKEIARAPLRAFAPQQPVRVNLPNGMVILLQADHELPLVEGYALIRGGSREEPAEKVGLVEIFGQAWRTGGTKIKGHAGDELDEYLEARAASVETWGGLDATGVAWSCLKENLEEVLPIVEELLETEPAFPPDKIELARTQVQTEIARRNDSPDGIAQREARKLAYGPASPYARHPEYATLRAVTRDDLARWHETYVHPNNVVMAVWGDFDSRTMEARLRKAFGSWAKGAPARAAAVPAPGPKPGTYLIEKEDVTQSKIQMVHLGARLDSPDYFALEVMNEVFGGGFSSRLFTNVRTKKGLAYGVWGSVGMAYDHPGVFVVGMGTKSEGTLKGIDALLEEIDGLQAHPPTDAELARAKDSLLNSFIFRIDSKEKVLRQKVSDLFHGYPLDRLERYQAGIQAVRAADVARVARQYVHKQKLAVLVVGKPGDFDRPLTTLGPVTTIDITIPNAEPAP